MEKAKIERMKEDNSVTGMPHNPLQRPQDFHAMNHLPGCFSGSLGPKWLHRFISSLGFPVACLNVRITLGNNRKQTNIQK